MARTIRFDEIGSYAEEKYESLLRTLVFATELKLKEGSPVDTGRFRGSWITSENQEVDFDAGEAQPATGQYRGQTKPPKEPALERRKSVGYQAGQEKIGNVYHITNSLPYAERLANGHSTQAPAGWVDIIAAEMIAYGRQQANAIGRKD